MSLRFTHPRGEVIEKQGGSLKDSYLEEGFILEKRIVAGPKVIKNCKARWRLSSPSVTSMANSALVL